MAGHTLTADAFDADYLALLRLQIRKSPWFTTNNLNRDFVGTQGFSVVFRRERLAQVVEAFPWAERYLARALRADCNAFYLNPLQLAQGSVVRPHIDRSLHAYVLEVDPPRAVSVLYVDVPSDLRGGELVLRRGRRFLGRVTPRAGLLVEFEGDLEHAVERVDSAGRRLSLVCEQYALDDAQLARVPDYRIESRAKAY
ncbi:MAG: 2OG-Fe(II) oxygenase [Planctomycetes bacterium]|nr:2OG-Fe(II) oxygenase [Planctomycetota bacterium]